jgi:hypothetical protein|tara:strand:+ start:451 stop:690 length:240 start_codon:yes stop_codon:yes gene_type:complete
MNTKPIEGEFYKHKTDVGYVTFICSDYLTLCVKETEDKDTMNGLRQVKVIVNRDDWKNMNLLNKSDFAEVFPHQFNKDK